MREKGLFLLTKSKIYIERPQRKINCAPPFPMGLSRSVFCLGIYTMVTSTFGMYDLINFLMTVSGFT